MKTHTVILSSTLDAVLPTGMQGIIGESTQRTYLHSALAWDGAGAVFAACVDLLGNEANAWIRKIAGGRVVGEWRFPAAPPEPGPSGGAPVAYKADSLGLCLAGADLLVLMGAHQAIVQPRKNVLALTTLAGVATPFSGGSGHGRPLPPGPTIPIFNDVPPSAAEFGAVQALAMAGLISGYDNPDGSKSYRPGANLTRGQMANLLARALGWEAQ